MMVKLLAKFPRSGAGVPRWKEMEVEGLVKVEEVEPKATVVCCGA